MSSCNEMDTLISIKMKIFYRKKVLCDTDVIREVYYVSIGRRIWQTITRKVKKQYGW